MRTEITGREPIVDRNMTAHQRALEESYEFLLIVGDEDREHGHDGGGHSFPATRDQLLALYQQLGDLIAKPWGR